METIGDPHAGQLVLRRGAHPRDARVSVILVHGRGASAADMLSLAEEFGVPDVAYVAPQAAGQTWYPSSFLSPIANNEPAVTSAMRLVQGLMATLGDEGVARDRVVLIGFSQGACLSLEFAARHAARYGAVVGLSGGLIGPPGTPRDYAGSLAGTPVLIGCSDVDPHIPVDRVRESGGVFRALGAAVDERIYPGMGHTVNRDEIEAVRALLASF